DAQRLSLTGSFGWNVTTGEIFWSEESFRIFAYDRVPAVSIEMAMKRVHPDDVDRVLRVFERAALVHEEFDLELRLLMPDSSVKFVHVIAHPVVNDPERLEFAGALMDITARKQAFAELELSQVRYRDLFKSMPISMLHIDVTRLVD